MTDANDFFNEHYSYIKAGAEVSARDIVRKTHTQMYEKDFVQELMYAVFHKAHLYSPDRSRPKTFITMVIGSTRKNILNRLMRKSSERVSFASDPLDTELLDESITDLNITMAVEEMPEEAQDLWAKALQGGFNSLNQEEREKLKSALADAGLSEKDL